MNGRTWPRSSRREQLWVASSARSLHTAFGEFLYNTNIVGVQFQIMMQVISRSFQYENFNLFYNQMDADNQFFYVNEILSSITEGSKFLIESPDTEVLILLHSDKFHLNSQATICFA